MYKIFLLVRASETKPLWTLYMEDGAIYESDDLDAVEEKVKELLNGYTYSQIRVVKDINYSLDILFEA